jgi:hypothetical protein
VAAGGWRQGDRRSDGGERRLFEKNDCHFLLALVRLSEHLRNQNFSYETKNSMEPYPNIPP